MFVLQLMDNYVSSWSVFIMAAGESALVGWVYGMYQTVKPETLKGVFPDSPF